MNKNLFTDLPLIFWTAEGTPTGGTTTPTTPATGAEGSNGSGGETPPAKTGEAPNPNPTKTEDPAPVSPNTTEAELREKLERSNRRVSELNKECATHRHNSSLADADRTELAEWRKTGLKPADALAVIEEGRTLKATASRTAKESGARTAADKAGFDGEAFIALRGVLDADYEVRTETKDGKTTETVVAKFKGSDGKDAEKPFADYVAQTWPSMVERVKKVPTTPSRGTPHVRQNGGGGDPKDAQERVKTEVKRRHDFRM